MTISDRAREVAGKLAELADNATRAAEYADKYPGHVETNGRVIADLYASIASLAVLSGQALTILQEQSNGN